MISDTQSKVEFAVQIKNPACVNTVKLKLKEVGVKDDQIESIIDSGNKECRMVITTSKPWIELQNAIESTNRKSALVGFSDEAAVVMLDKGNKAANVKGVFRFCSIVPNKPGVVIDGVIDGLEKVEHAVNIREFGDISQGSSSLGDVYKHSSYRVTPDESGRATIRTTDEKLHVFELIGRSVTVSPTCLSETNIVYGVICRAAGIFQNWKRICACDGTTIWDERDRPLAGVGRGIKD